MVHLNGSSDWWICYINVSVGQICLANPQLYGTNTHFLPVFLGSHMKKIYDLFHYVGTAVNLEYFNRPCNKHLRAKTWYRANVFPGNPNERTYGHLNSDLTQNLDPNFAEVGGYFNPNLGQKSAGCDLVL